MNLRAGFSCAMRLWAALCALAIAAASQAQLRVVNYNIAKLGGDQGALASVFVDLNADDKPGFAVAPHLYVFQEVQQANVAALGNLLNAAAPAGVVYALGTYTTSVAEDGSGGAQAMFYRTDTLAEIPAEHKDIATGAGRKADRWKLQLIDYSSAAASFHIYSAHLKADDSQADALERAMGVAAIRTDAASIPAGAHIIYAGDNNIYNNMEQAYLNYIVAGNGQAVDPLGNGSWAGSGNAIKHTQSPRAITDEDLVGGGLDDRFDLQLSTAAMHDGAGLSIIPGTYRAFGNDGQHYNQAINAGNNTYYPADIARSNAVADDIFDASDHVPLVVDYQIPAAMSASAPANFGRVIQSAAFNLAISVSNIAEVVTPLGADLLDFTATGVSGVSGMASGSDAALGGPATANLPVNTSAVGIIKASAIVSASSQAAQNNSIVVVSSGTIVRHANASFSAPADENQFTLPVTLQADTGVQSFSVSVFNFGFDAMQAMLDIDSVTGAASPFAFVSGLASGIGDAPAELTFSFNTNGAAAGLHTKIITIHTSDENIPGATSATITLTLNVTIQDAAPIVGDINGDGVVGPFDLAQLLSQWGRCPAPPVACPGDIAPSGGDGIVGPADLAQLLAHWG